MGRRKSMLSYEVMHDPWLRGHKVAYVFFALACITLAATGLATLPRPTVLVDDLATRLDGASAFASSLLAASDGLLGAAAGLRPILSDAAGVLQGEPTAQTLGTDVPCASTLLDAGLSDPAALRSQLVAVTTALRDGVVPALAAAAALLTATSGPNGATPALAAVAAMPTALSAISGRLASYDDALAALPASRQPTSTSNQAVAALQAAQAALDLPGWLASLDAMQDSIRTVVSAAQALPYARLAAALRDLRAASVAVNTSLTPATTSLVALDTLYLGTPEQQQQQGDLVAGRACLARLVQQLGRFDTTMFRFNGSLHRSALNAAFATQTSLERLYGAVYGSAAVAGVVNGTGNSSAAGVLTPTADGMVQTAQLLAPLAVMDDAAIAAQCVVVQSVLSYSNGSSALPDVSPTLSYLAALRTSLAALQQPAGGVASALTAYAASPSDAVYGSLYDASGSTKAAAATARSAASAPTPSGSAVLVASAANAAATASSGSMAAALRDIMGNASAATVWLASNGSQSAALQHSTAALATMQAALDRARAQLVQAGWTAAAAPPPPPAQALNSSANGTVSSSPPPLPSTSAFLQPLQRSIELVARTLSNGIAAVSEELDNALGKVLQSPPPSPSSRRRSRQLLQSSPFDSAAAAAANSTTIVRQQLVKRMDSIAASLRGEPSRRYSTAAYWSAVAVYSAFIAVCLLLGLSIIFNFPAGVVLALVAHLVLAALVLLGAWAVAAGAVVTRDACGNADGLVLAAVSPSSPLFPLVRYYLQGVGGSLPSVLRTTGLGDTARLAAAADTLYSQVLNPLLLAAPPDTANATAAANTTSNDPWPGSLGTVQFALGGVLVDLGAVAAAVSVDLATLLRLGDRAAVLAQYITVTSWACCGLGGQLLVAWVCATGCGVMAWLAGLSGVMVLKNLDEMPPDSSSCGCRCYNPRDFPRPVHRRRGSSNSSGGGVTSSSGSGGGAGAEGALAKPLALRGPPPPQRPPQPQLPPQQPVPVPRGPPLASTASRSQASGVAAAAAASKASPASKTSTSHGKGGQEPTRREVVVESALFQGPAGAIAAAGWGSPKSVPPRGSPLPPASRQPGSSVSVCVMDPETAAVLRYGSEEAKAAAAAVQPSAPLPPAPR